MRPTLLLLASMIGLQLLWLGAVWATQATANRRKVVALGIYSVVAGTAVLTFSIFGPPVMRKLNLCSPAAPCLPFSEGARPGITLSGSATTTVLASLCLLTLGLGMIYAHYQRVWPFDEEGNYGAARLVARDGVRTYFNQYPHLKWLGMQHPPLIPLIGGGMLRLFGQRLFSIRLVSVACCAGTAAVTYLLGRTLYGEVTGLLAALLLLSFPLIWRQGAAAMLDMPITFLFALALLLALQLPHAAQPVWLAIITGIVMGTGLLTKYTMVLIYPIFIPLFVWQEGQWPTLFTIMFISGGMLGIWLAFSAHLGVLGKQLKRLVIYSGARPGDSSREPQSSGMQARLGIRLGWRMRLRLETLFSRLPSALGVYSLPWLLVGGLALLNASTGADLPVILWIGVTFPLLLVVFPDHRYFMPTFPAFALLMARGALWYSPFIAPLICLALLYCAGDLYLFLDWTRQRHLFSRSGV